MLVGSIYYIFCAVSIVRNHSKVQNDASSKTKSTTGISSNTLSTNGRSFNSVHPTPDNVVSTANDQHELKGNQLSESTVSGRRKDLMKIVKHFIIASISMIVYVGVMLVLSNLFIMSYSIPILFVGALYIGLVAFLITSYSHINVAIKILNRHNKVSG